MIKCTTRLVLVTQKHTYRSVIIPDKIIRIYNRIWMSCEACVRFVLNWMSSRMPITCIYKSLMARWWLMFASFKAQTLDNFRFTRPVRLRTRLYSKTNELKYFARILHDAECKQLRFINTHAVIQTYFWGRINCIM